MKKEPTFLWDEETGVAICVLTDGKKEFTGMAMCDEADREFQSEKTGCQIALYRAELAYLKHVRDNEIKPAIKTLKHLYYTMKQSTHFNENSYENKMVWKSIYRQQFDLDVINKMIVEKRKNLRDYLDEKEKFYKKIRFFREAEKGQK